MDLFLDKLVSVVSAGTDSYLPHSYDPIWMSFTFSCFIFTLLVSVAYLMVWLRQTLVSERAESLVTMPFLNQDGCTCAFTKKIGHGSIKRYPNESPRCQLSWWSGSIISAQIVVPFLPSWSLGRKSVKCPGSSNSSMELLLCPLGEGFPFWEPELLTHRAQSCRDGKHKVSQCVTGSHVTWNLSSFHPLVPGPMYSIYWGHGIIERLLI